MLRFPFCYSVALLALAGPASADERSVVEDARDGKLEARGLLESAIALSGQSSMASSSEMLSRFADLCDSAKRFDAATRSDQAKTQFFLRQLHASLLRGRFDADCDTVEQAFQTGRHNCVTSLILALEFCRRQKIPATGMQKGHHVWLRVGDTAEGDLETTQLPVSNASRSGATIISDSQLLARLAYNQARSQHDKGSFAEAAKKLEWCLLIDPDFLPAERNLRIVLSNWVVSADNDSRFSEALAVSQRAVARFPEDAELRNHASDLQARWARSQKKSAE
jgi:tetratricopeptide (TPR) repeat protein